ncbi:hypothetical protein F5Y19DRAFT_449987 [Xylariaceae sp. FL1651]|nr:hypothetical protein F5Y19DRAFT_449987 [Xylariaceae sp. FL1651]
MMVPPDTGIAVPQPRRTYHKKSKTGCSTCKKRRVKCGGAKPHCNRCISTGRQCGYIQPLINQPDSESIRTRRSPNSNESSTSLTQAAPVYSRHRPPVELKVALPRSNSKEVRSYHFFLEVAAPLLAGVFDADFWTTEIPRACFVDRAIWHAVVSLGATYEAYYLPPLASPAAHSNENSFVLQQCNYSIRSLTDSSHYIVDKWRTLTASVLFTYLCSLQNLHEQARMHLTAGYKILKVILIDDRNKRLSPEPASASKRINYFKEVVDIRGPSTTPVTLATLQVVIANLESHATALDNGDLKHETAVNHSYNMWHFYRAPFSIGRIATRSPLNPPTGIEFQWATRENIINANRAAESLLYGLILYSQQNADRLAAVIGKGDKDSFGVLVSGQEPYSRCFAEISAALHAFNVETGACTGNVRNMRGAEKSKRKALLCLQLLVTTTRLLLFRNPDSPDQQVSTAYLCTQYEEIVTISERILQLNSDRTSFIPSPSPTQPLFLVAHSGFPQSIRRRAISLLRAHPRCDGLWDTNFSAALAEMIMEHEKIAARRRISAGTLGGVAAPQSDDADSEYGVVNTLDRIYSYKVLFQKGRHAKVSMRTWKDFLDGLPATQSLLTW